MENKQIWDCVGKHRPTQAAPHACCIPLPVHVPDCLCLTEGTEPGAHPAHRGKARGVCSETGRGQEEQVLPTRDGPSGSIISGCSSSHSVNTSGQMRCFCQSLKMHGIPTESSPSQCGCLGDIQHLKKLLVQGWCRVSEERLCRWPEHV